MAAPTTPPEIVPVIEEDDPGIAVPQGTQCRRNGCKALFVSDELSRFGNGEEAVCIYHSAPVLPLFLEFTISKPLSFQPIFREGSKVIHRLTTIITFVDIKSRDIYAANVEFSSLMNFSRSKDVKVDGMSLLHTNLNKQYVDSIYLTYLSHMKKGRGNGEL